MNKSQLIIFLRKHKIFFYLALITFLGLYLRLYNINWDNNYYFHPDERAIIMFAVDIRMPANIEEFFSIQSPLNPHFFAYGTFPIYILKLVANFFSYINPLLNTYGGIHLIGRPLSALFDTATILIVFLIGKRLFSVRSGLFASFLYSISVLPIQLSHFFAVDTILTFFISVSILLLIKFATQPSKTLGIFIGISIGLAVTTKVSALILAPVLVFGLFSSLYKTKKSKKLYINVFVASIISITAAIASFAITQPYALIDWGEFIKQTSLQSQMSKNAYLFPYTLQYVNKTPYLYELKNIFLWGLGPLITTLSFIGLIAIMTGYVKDGGKKGTSIFLFFIAFYFIIFGSFAVGYMRYMLPLYPFLVIGGGYLISEILIPLIPKRYHSSVIKRKILLVLFVIITMLYPLSFISIYKYPNTRVQATDWIIDNIAPGSVIAIEHWDDALPLREQGRYNTVTLPLYNRDDQNKWNLINSQLNKTDYIILASHRLYVPLQKLKNCKDVKEGYCYPLTASYYENLFNGKLGFEKIAEFESHPKVPFLPIYIDDFESDENFTVFDHPKITIFKKVY